MGAREIELACRCGHVPARGLEHALHEVPLEAPRLLLKRARRSGGGNVAAIEDTSKNNRFAYAPAIAIGALAAALGW